jgi:hypothetical protein
MTRGCLEMVELTLFFLALTTTAYLVKLAMEKKMTVQDTSVILNWRSQFIITAFLMKFVESFDVSVFDALVFY